MTKYSIPLAKSFKTVCCSGQLTAQDRTAYLGEERLGVPEQISYVHFFFFCKCVKRHHRTPCSYLQDSYYISHIKEFCQVFSMEEEFQFFIAILPFKKLPNWVCTQRCYLKDCSCTTLYMIYFPKIINLSPFKLLLHMCNAIGAPVNPLPQNLLSACLNLFSQQLILLPPIPSIPAVQ